MAIPTDRGSFYIFQQGTAILDNFRKRIIKLIEKLYTNTLKRKKK